MWTPTGVSQDYSNIMTVYLLETSELTAGQLERMNFGLPIERQQRSRRIKNPAAQRESIAAAYLAYFGLTEGNTDSGLVFPTADILLSKSEQVSAFSTFVGWPVDKGGKPFVSGIQKDSRRLYVGISHSEGLAAAAIADEPVGADVQKIPQTSPEQMLRIAAKFHPAETARLAALSKEKLPAAFCRLWVCKESVMKLCGRGMALPLSSFCIEESGDSSLDGRKIRLSVNELKGAFFAAAFWK